jgi:hypothetical protein
VNKEPERTLTVTNESHLMGYDTITQTTDYTLTPISSVFSGVILHPREVQYEANNFIKTNTLYDGKTRLKVMLDAKEFIESGKTESITFDGTVWNVDGPPRPSDYLGLRFYYYPIVQVK